MSNVPTTESKLTFYIVIKTSTDNCAELYQLAEGVGPRVVHFDNLKCRTFEDSMNPGRFVREIGVIKFDKKARDWTVIAAVDCNARELAGLIRFGMAKVARHGRTPGHNLRGREWWHGLHKKSGHPVAKAWVATPVDDLTEGEELSLSIPDDIGQLSGLLEAFRVEVSA